MGPDVDRCGGRDQLEQFFGAYLADHMGLLATNEYRGHGDRRGGVPSAFVSHDRVGLASGFVALAKELRVPMPIPAAITQAKVFAQPLRVGLVDTVRGIRRDRRGSVVEAAETIEAAAHEGHDFRGTGGFDLWCDVDQHQSASEGFSRCPITDVIPPIEAPTSTGFSPSSPMIEVRSATSASMP